MAEHDDRRRGGDEAGAPDTPAPADPIDHARRRLLSLARYVPPAVLGVLVLDQVGCAPAPSCNPQTCKPKTTPCTPDNSPCAPANGCNPSTCNPATCNPKA